MHDADREGAIVGGHGVDRDDLARHLADRGATRGQRGAGMARLADGLEIEPCDRVAPGDDAVIGAARLRHQYVFVARRLGFDDVAGRGGADLFVRGEQHRDRQRRREGGARQLPDRFEREIAAAFHIIDAGAEAFVVFAPPFELFQRADRVNGIEMPGDQDPGLALLRVREARADTAAEALPSRDALDRCAHDRHVARGDVEHAVDRGGVPGRALAFHPNAQTLQHGLGIEGKVGRIHLRRSS
jgi:hypothetical protein